MIILTSQGVILKNYELEHSFYIVETFYSDRENEHFLIGISKLGNIHIFNIRNLKIQRKSRNYGAVEALRVKKLDNGETLIIIGLKNKISVFLFE